MRAGPFPVDVDTAAIDFGSRIRDIHARIAFLVTKRRPKARRLIGLHSFAAHERIEQTRSEERRVSNDLRIESEARAASVKPVFRIIHITRMTDDCRNALLVPTVAAWL